MYDYKTILERVHIYIYLYGEGRNTTFEKWFVQIGTQIAFVGKGLGFWKGGEHGGTCIFNSETKGDSKYVNLIYMSQICYAWNDSLKIAGKYGKYVK